MKSLQSYINEQNLNKEDLKDLEICIKVSLENFMFKSKDKNMIDTLVKIADGNINDTYKEFETKFKKDYDFDLDDEQIFKSFKSLVYDCAKQLIDEYKLVEKYKK